MLIDTAKTSTDDIYRILIGSVLPRPIAWVSTISESGTANLAPFSFFTVASVNPPYLCFSPGFKAGVIDNKVVAVPKDTLRNIQHSKEFVVNIVSRSVAEKMSMTSGEYAADVSEFDACGLTQAPSSMVRPARVAESLINMECKLHQLVELGHKPGGGTLVIGRILCIHIDDSVYSRGRIDIDVLEPIGRLAGNLYCSITDQFEIGRPRV